VLHALGVADLVVQPSRWEAFSMVILEAMAMGKALVVSDIPAHREALADIGWYHPVGDAAALAESIRSALADPARRAHHESLVRSRVERFGHEVCVDRYLQLVSVEPPATSGPPAGTYHQS
jgi:glycosyltransferase involved in cell wall biosynthesis